MAQTNYNYAYPQPNLSIPVYEVKRNQVVKTGQQLYRCASGRSLALNEVVDS